MDMVYQVDSFVDGGRHDSRVFRTKDRAVTEAEHLAEVFAAMYRVPMTRRELGKFGIVVTFGDDNDTMIRVEEHEVQE